MLMLDTLRLDSLPAYGSMSNLPNFKRLEEKCVVFDNFYASSLPCMPARREMQTGYPNFLHRGWGPLEPFDVSFAETLKRNGVYTHIITDTNIIGKMVELLTITVITVMNLFVVKKVIFIKEL